MSYHAIEFRPGRRGEAYPGRARRTEDEAAPGQFGFRGGADVTVINEVAGNLIVRVKEARIAISRSAANRIMV